MFNLKCTALTLLAATGLVSALPYKLGAPRFFGSGCPKDTVAVVPSTDGATISVLFSEFGATTADDRFRQYKACNLAVPLDLEPGYTIALTQVDYRGNAYVPSGVNSSAEFSASYFFAGSQGPESKRIYSGGYSGDIYASDFIGTAAWAPCGASTVFRVNANVVASKVSANDGDVQIAIDSADGKLGGFYYKFVSKRC